MVFELDEAGRIKKLKSLASVLTGGDVVKAIKTYLDAGRYRESYSHSTTYDLIVDGERYPPKAIFGIALSEKLGNQVYSHHFSGGKGSPCFDVLSELGFNIESKAKELSIYSRYTREDMASIFDPHYEFKAGSGRWGISGIVAGKPKQSDFVFIVTLAERDGNEYEDYFTEDGVFFWKSQNRHTPASKIIQDLCGHDADSSTIYLFVRSNREDKYTYLGPLSFRDWDPLSSAPVHFQWDMVSWPLPDAIKSRFNDFIKPSLSSSFKREIPAGIVLTEESVPKGGKRGSKVASTGVHHTDWAVREKKNRELGLAGELAVIESEKQRLIAAGRQDLAERVDHIALVQSSAGYDVRSFDTDGSERFIEVKTTTQGKSAPFYISLNEVFVSSQLRDRYWIYRLYNFHPQSKAASFYAQKGAVEEHFDLVAESYRAFSK